ncbi:TetR/AcrR family transcriptional regulator [Tsukamurella sp. NPDC003166]|uniref:TetR/AcrR family transcriptional regulator n=1 Tax=Tsukamurella sp. NPDC003166 TaxID=3154444 RepID=UPI0033B757BF
MTETMTTGPRVETRERLVNAAAQLFSQQGYAATGIKAVLAEAKAPYGSLYHYFPGGKQELGSVAIAHGGARYREVIESIYTVGGDVVEATAESFREAARRLETTDYVEACPVASIALEIASSDQVIRAVAAEAFESWLHVLEDRFAAAGMSADKAREVAVEVFCLMEGSALLARTTRSTTSVEIAGRTATKVVANALG